MRRVETDRNNGYEENRDMFPVNPENRQRVFELIKIPKTLNKSKKNISC